MVRPTFKAMFWLLSVLSVSLPVTASRSFADDRSMLQSAICARTGTGLLDGFDSEDRPAVTAFYAARDCRPLWVDETGTTRAADLAIAEIRRADEWGLRSADFPFAALSRPKAEGRWTSDETADAELEITASVLRYAHQAQGGRIPNPEVHLSSYIDRQPSLSSAQDILAKISQSQAPDVTLR